MPASLDEALTQGLAETARKVEASLIPAIEEHINSEEFSTSHGLDFLDTKNSLLLSYLIDLTVHLRSQLAGEQPDDQNRERLLEMRTVLDKTRNLDKKLRYQIEKLLTAQSNATSFAAGEDPLQFRPRVDSLAEDDDASGSEDGSDNDVDDLAEDDDDLALARRTIRMAKGDKDDEESDEKEPTVYRAPRLEAVPYTHDKEDRQAEREKRQRRRMRASELAQALRSQYGDAPEQEDIHGGSEVGKQRESARRMAEREAAKTKFEEDQMVRLTTSRKEKKERKRLMREESSNLSAIADLGNLVRDAAYGEDEDRGRNEPSDGLVMESGRHDNGRRKRQILDNDGRVIQHQKGKKRSMRAKNHYQAALFEGGGSSERPKKLKKNKKRSSY